ncbi:hypothetical protein A9Q81_14745 [Gammaproteobacteria bacterium 42_54_T18]|nr:hypothetical protein A9Q81_14745 [Gammaproteobacteria bacterium 42_54_T18]
MLEKSRKKCLATNFCKHYSQFYHLLFVLFSLCLLTTSSHAKTTQNDSLLLHNNLEHYVLGSSVSIAQTPKDWRLDDILKTDDSLFIKSTENTPNIGYSENAIWVKISVTNTAQQQKWLLSVEKANINSVTLFEKTTNQQWYTRSIGNQFPFSQRTYDFKYPVFPVVINSTTEVNSTTKVNSTTSKPTIFYLKILSKTAISIPLTLKTEHLFSESSSQQSLINGIYIGILLIIAFYSLTTYIAIKESGYLLFFLSLMSFGLYVLSIQGYAHQYFWPNATWWSQHAILFFAATTTVFSLRFCRIVMITREQAPFADNILAALEFLAMLNVIFSLTLDYTLMGKFSLIFSSALAFTLIGIGIIVARQGYRPAKLYLLSWVSFSITALLRSVTFWGWSPIFTPQEYDLQLGSLLGILFLFLSVTDKIRLINQQNTTIKQKALHEKTQANIELERQIWIRTKDLTIAKIQLEKNQRSQTEFFNRINHEIRTPTTAILQYSSFLQRGIECDLPSKDQLQHLEVVASNGQRINKLTEQLLDLAKNQANEEKMVIRTINISALIHTVIDELPRLFPEDVQLNFTHSPPLWVQADKQMLISIIENLLSNAAKYTSSGNVTVKITKITNTEPSPNTEMIKVTVSDTGTGLSKEEIPQIFSPFKRFNTTQNITGIGIGLNLCKVQLERMAGSIGVNSKKGKGSDFWFTLPLAVKEVTTKNETSNIST